MFYNISLINPEKLLHVNGVNFEEMALQVFHYQYANNQLYREYCNALHTNVATIDHLTQIPFLPVSFFKTHTILTNAAATINEKSELIFESSGTTGEIPSRHHITDPGVYERSLIQGFEEFYGPVEQYTILALLPSYLERKNASLVHMAKTLMEKSGHPDNGFYINEWSQLHNALSLPGQNGQKILLLGVTFALLDFAAAYPMALQNTIVMETGGMKGRREELTRTEVHSLLKKQWELDHIHSEYGMTELLSQAYALRDGIFKPTATMKVLVRDINDPLDVKESGQGCLNIVDLANINSCSFIATEDIGNIAADGSFEVLGRMDHSALRGCSLMAI